MAIIGSANINRRGLYFDSEVCAAIFDVPPAMAQGRFSFAQQLRTQLWAEHLGVDRSKVRSAIEAKEMWFDKGVQSYIRQYRQNDGTDADDITGWLFARPFAGDQQAGSSSVDPSSMMGDDVRLPQDEAERAWNWILDPMDATKLKKCS